MMHLLIKSDHEDDNLSFPGAVSSTYYWYAEAEGATYNIKTNDMHLSCCLDLVQSLLSQAPKWIEKWSDYFGK